MGAAGAASVVFRKEIAAAEDPAAERKAKIEQYSGQFATPYMAASRGFVDLVIKPSETRARLLDALELLECKERRGQLRQYAVIKGEAQNGHRWAHPHRGIFDLGKFPGRNHAEISCRGFSSLPVSPINPMSV